MRDDELRQINSAMAVGYDAIPFDFPADPAVDIDAVNAIAREHGIDLKRGDLLDIGCGTGALLAHLAPRFAGRLVGTDISPSASAKARQRLAVCGDRAAVVQADLLDVQADQLGVFDVVLCIGVLYVLPAEARRAALDLIGRCLKPSGVAIISYVAGTAFDIRAPLFRLLRAATAHLTDPAARITVAREKIKAMIRELPANTLHQPLSITLSYVASYGDATFYHEILNSDYVALSTIEIERALSEHAVGFLNYLPSQAFGGLPTSRERAMAASTLDYFVGDYRHALFARLKAT